MVEVSINKAYWTRRKVVEKSNMKHDEQYTNLD